MLASSCERSAWRRVRIPSVTQRSKIVDGTRQNGGGLGVVVFAGRGGKPVVERQGARKGLGKKDHKPDTRFKWRIEWAGGAAHSSIQSKLRSLTS